MTLPNLHTRWIVVGAASQLALGALLALVGEVWAARIWLLLGPLVGALAGEALALIVTARRLLRRARAELDREGLRLDAEPIADAPRRPVTAGRVRRSGANVVPQGSDASA